MVWDALGEEGVNVVFGYPGGAIMPVYDAMLDASVRHVLVRHEQGAAHMADGYARASGKVGVALATSGPGATNLVTGIATAMLDSSPIVCITGQVQSSLLGSDAFQETDITGVTLPITKHNYLVTDASEIGPTLREAFEVADPDGPVRSSWTSPRTRSRGMAVFPWEDRPRLRRRTPASGAGETATSPGDRADRRRGTPGHPRRPRHSLASEAGQELLAFAEKTGIPVASTLLGLGGFPASHALALGMMGMHGEAWVNVAIQKADMFDRPRDSFRRSGHRQAGDLRSARQEDPRARSTPPRSTRT